MLSDLATVAKNLILRTAEEPVPFDLVTSPTPQLGAYRAGLAHRQLLSSFYRW
jgi:hypothetical protein